MGNVRLQAASHTQSTLAFLTPVEHDHTSTHRHHYWSISLGIARAYACDRVRMRAAERGVDKERKNRKNPTPTPKTHSYQLERDLGYLQGLNGETLRKRRNGGRRSLSRGAALVLSRSKHGFVRDWEQEELEHTHVGGAHHLGQNSLRGKSLEAVCTYHVSGCGQCPVSEDGSETQDCYDPIHGCTKAQQQMQQGPK